MGEGGGGSSTHWGHGLGCHCYQAHNHLELCAEVFCRKGDTLPHIIVVMMTYCLSKLKKKLMDLIMKL
jgi:hypothetical protein